MTEIPSPDQNHPPIANTEAENGIDLRDFSEPTPETWTHFFRVLEALKMLAKTEGTTDVVDLSEEDPFSSPPIDGTVEINMCSLDLSGSHLSVAFATPSNERIMPALETEGNAKAFPLKQLRWGNPKLLLEYTERYGERPSLYVRREGDAGMLIPSEDTSSLQSQDGAVGIALSATPEIMKEMNAVLAHRRTAKEHGLNNPTEGSLRLLTEKLQDCLDESDLQL